MTRTRFSAIVLIATSIADLHGANASYNRQSFSLKEVHPGRNRAETVQSGGTHEGKQSHYDHLRSGSYLSVSAMKIDGEPLTEVEPDALLICSQTDARDEEIASASAFLVNGISVEQFRFLENERVNFVLLLEPTQEGVLQLDYSVPVERFEQEARKLESSIGSIRPQ